MAGETPRDGSSFGPDAVRHVAQLARLDLDEERVNEMAWEVGRILEAADALKDLDLTGEEAVYLVGWEEALPHGDGTEDATDTPSPVASGLRPDVQLMPLNRDLFLAEAPRTEAMYVVVPTVVDRT